MLVFWYQQHIRLPLNTHVFNKLKHASGNGVSITAPSSNPAADRTLELPSDADGIIAKTDTSGNLNF